MTGTRPAHTSLLHSDPPDHTRLRRLVTSVFTRRGINVICELIGIPTEAGPDFRNWAPLIVSPDIHGFEAYQGAALAMLAYTRGLIEDERRQLLAAGVGLHREREHPIPVPTVGHGRPDLVRRHARLDDGLGGGDQIEIPVGLGQRIGRPCDDDKSIAIRQVVQHNGVIRTRPAPGGREQEHAPTSRWAVRGRLAG